MTMLFHPLGIPTHLPRPTLSAHAETTPKSGSIALKAEGLMTGYADISG